MGPKAALITAVCGLALGGCSTTPANLEANTAPKSQTYAENYQEIYRRVAGTAKRCFSSEMGKYAAMTVDSELYSELGRGEVSVSLVNMGTRNYYLSAKIQRTGPRSSEMTVNAGNTLGSERMTGMVFDWARSDGNMECPLI